MEWELVTLQSLGDALECVLTLPEAAQPPALIVCHGYLRSRQDYAELCNYLGERGIATLALNMHGHGNSGGKPYAMTIKEWVADVRSATIFLRSHPRISEERIGVLGHNSGGTAALEAAILDVWLKAVVAVAPRVRSTFQDPTDLFFWLLTQLGWVIRRLAGKDLHLSLDQPARWIRLAADPQDDQRIRSDPHFSAGLRRVPFPGSAQSRYVRTLRRLHHLTVPVLLIWGEQDQVTPISHARSLWNALPPDKEMISLPNCGHFPLLEGEKEKVWEQVGDWLETKL